MRKYRNLIQKFTELPHGKIQRNDKKVLTPVGARFSYNLYQSIIFFQHQKVLCPMSNLNHTGDVDSGYSRLVSSEDDRTHPELI